MRECDCPKWIIRCAHLDNKVLAMGDRELVPDGHGPVISPKYEIIMGDKDDLLPCTCCKESFFGLSISFEDRTDSPEEATRIFEEAERKLLAAY